MKAAEITPWDRVNNVIGRIDLSRFPIPITLLIGRDAGSRLMPVSFDIVYSGRDRDTGKPLDVTTFNSLAPHSIERMDGREIAEYILMAVDKAIRHELFETFRFDDVRMKEVH